MKKQTISFIIAFIILLSICAPTVHSIAQPKIIVSSVSGVAGETVSVDISVENNPGLASLILNVSYSDALTITSVTFNSAFGAYTTTPEPYANPQKLTMMSPLSDITANGVFATITFKIAENAAQGKYDISVSYKPGDVFNSNFENVTMSVENGYVDVASTSSAVAANIKVGSVKANAGDTVSVDIIVENNPGLASLIFEVSYSNALTITSVTFNSAFGVYTTTPEPYTNPQKLTMMSPLSDITANGVFATITFKIAENATFGKHDVCVSYKSGDVFNSNFDNVTLTMQNGSVVIESYLPGDIDGDGDVDKYDVDALLKYLNGWDVKVVDKALDTDGDGEVNIRDAATLLLYVEGKIDQLN